MIGKFRYRILLTSFLGFFFLSGEAQLAVIVNKSVKETELNMKDLKQIYKGSVVRWNDNTRIILCMMKPETDLGKLTCKKVIGKSVFETNKMFLALVFQGVMNAPKFFTSENELKKFVNSNAGGIGILSKDSVAGARIMKIDGYDNF
jgi:ABC-type phosphate transport system substrate-binding protein